MKKKKTSQKRVTNYRHTDIKKSNYQSSRSNSANKNRNIKRKKKMRINKITIYRNLFFIFAIIIIIVLAHSFFVQRAITKKNEAVQVQEQQKEATTAKMNLEKRNEFFTKEAKILSDLQRFNENVGLVMNYPSSVVNIYPDSLNAATALKNNLSEYAQYLSSTELSNVSSFINNLVSANTTYINAVVAYNKLISSSAPNMQVANSQKTTISNDYTNLNNLISKNQNIFTNK